MEAAFLALVVLVLGGGFLWILRSRARSRANSQASADKEATSARNDARAVQRSLDGRR